MANKKISLEGGHVVECHIKFRDDQKLFLDNLGISASAYLRELLDSRINGTPEIMDKFRDMELTGRAALLKQMGKLKMHPHEPYLEELEERT
jgi:hypothetical protein